MTNLEKIKEIQKNNEKYYMQFTICLVISNFLLILLIILWAVL